MPRRAWPSQRWCCRAQGRFPRTFWRRVVMACCFTLRLPYDCPSLQDRLSTGSEATFGGSDVAAVVWPPQSRRRAGRVRVGKYKSSRKACQWAVAVVGRSVAAATVPHLCPMHARYTRGCRPRHAPADACPRTTERVVGDDRVAGGVAAAVACQVCLCARL